MKGLYIFDTESDGLAGKSIPPEDHMTKFHVLLFKEYGKDNWNIFLDKDHEEFKEAEEFVEAKGVNLKVYDLEDFNDWIVGDPVAIGCQNLEGFDMLAFNFALGTEYQKVPTEKINGKEIRVFDTLSMSRYLYPDRPLPRGCPSKVANPNGGKAKTIGPHSLEAWGHKVANKKVEIEDWQGLPLWKYCDRVWEDVIINELQWQALIREMKDGSQKGVDWKVPLKQGLEADHLMVVQEQTGVKFDEDSAWLLLDRIDKMMEEIEASVEPKLPLKDVPKSKIPNIPKEPFDKQGNIGHHGWNYIEKVLEFPVDRSALEFKSPPKTAFKKTGGLSVAGVNYCIKHGVDKEEDMADFIRSQLKKEQTLSPLGEEDLKQATKLLKERFMPEKWLKEPMRLSNQEGIKTWLAKESGWVPTLFNTKNATIDGFKKTLPDPIVEENCWNYVEGIKESVYLRYISEEMGVNIAKISSKSHPDFKKILRKARFLITSPKLKDERGELCPNLDRIDGEMAKQIVKWLSLRNRRSVIKSKDEKKNTGWLNHPRLRLDGRLPARYTGLTPTFRRKHNIVANIPSTDALLGHEMRSLFCVDKGNWQLGIDGSNLEGMVAAEAAWDFDDGAYYRSLSGDPHTTNAKAYSAASGQEVSRGGGKGITYGIMYGAQAPKIGAMLGVNKEVGQKVIDAFWDTNFGLKGRKEYLEKFWESTGKKYILGFDNRKIWIRSKHSLLNAFLQSGGAIGMDLAGIIWHKKALEENLLKQGAKRTIYYHDEYQIEIPPELIRFKEFSTGFKDKSFIETVLKDVSKSKKNKKAGKEYKSAKEMCEEYNITMDQLKVIISAETDAKELDGGKFLLSGNVKVLPNGNVARVYSRTGELMVKAIGEAYVQMGFRVPITGEYLFGKNWADCH
ncbi:DNA polymerase [Vibrio phage 184E37-3b]|nr:hypothetical protein MYOV056v2_p0091 [Vibrio phage 184E37.3a]QZI89963.1 hypothetical protein MYOV057v1_p0048 [Vibrio phage 184E37.1]